MTYVRNSPLAVLVPRYRNREEILRHNDERGMSEREIVGSMTVLVNAGGESVAACVTAATFFMLRDAEILRKAMAEVRDAFPTQDPITLRKTAQLDYLNAVIEEALRCHPPAPGNFARRLGREGDIIDGHFIPPHVRAFCHARERERERKKQVY